MSSTKLNVNTSVQGDTIENKLELIMENKEPIAGEAPLLYTERKDGVMAGYNIRTDRFEVALDAKDVIQRSAVAKREALAKREKAEKDAKLEVIKGDDTAGKTGESKA